MITMEMLGKARRHDIDSLKGLACATHGWAQMLRIQELDAIVWRWLEADFSLKDGGAAGFGTVASAALLSG